MPKIAILSFPPDRLAIPQKGVQKSNLNGTYMSDSEILYLALATESVSRLQLLIPLQYERQINKKPTETNIKLKSIQSMINPSTQGYKSSTHTVGLPPLSTLLSNW
jgi:hypothetical protein